MGAGVSPLPLGAAGSVERSGAAPGESVAPSVPCAAPLSEGAPRIPIPIPCPLTPNPYRTSHSWTFQGSLPRVLLPVTF